MTVIVDSSFLAALYNKSDMLHQRADEFTFERGESMLVPNVVLTEVHFLLRRAHAYESSWKFFDFFRNANASLEPILMEDLSRISEIALNYATARFDLVDCCIMALAERQCVTRIATFDSRDFSIYRPRHCDYFELLP